MNLSDYYINGSNAKFVVGVLGVFWTRVFPAANGLVEAVSNSSGHTLDYGETFMRRMLGWLTGDVVDVEFMERLESVPVTSIRHEVIKIGEGHLIGHGAYIGAMNGSMRWIIPLNGAYADVPMVIPIGGKPLLKQADYLFDGKNLIFREKPSVMGLKSSLEDIDGLPTAVYNLLIDGCVPIDNGGSNFDFYKLPDNTRRAMLDLITNEASCNLIIRFVERCVGSMPPTVFEQYDEEGPFTVVTSVWLEEGRTYGITTGGEIIKVPKGFKLAEGMEYTEKLKLHPEESITDGIALYDKAVDSPIIGFKANDAFVLNEVKYTAAGDTGVIDPTGDWTTRLASILTSYGKSINAVFPAATENTISRVFDRLGRKQPAILYLNDVAASKVSEFYDALKILSDTLPAGSLMLVETDTDIAENNTIKTSGADSVEMFTAIVNNDPADFSITEKHYTRGTLL